MVELRDAAAADNKVLPVHRWVPWIAGFSAQFAADVIDAFLPKRLRDRALVLDPFAGVGTTLVEALKAGCATLGYEINGFAALAANAKIHCVDVVPSLLRDEIDAFRVAMQCHETDVDRRFRADGAPAVTELLGALRGAAPAQFRSRIPFFSAPVEAKFLYALHWVSRRAEPERSLFRIALGATMVSYSNYTYEPSLGSRPGAGKRLIDNASVGHAVGGKLDDMVEDIEWAQGQYGLVWRARRRAVHHASYFASALPPRSVSLLVTSPPYLNNYHYVRNTRPQLYWLGLVSGPDDLRQLERASFGRFWQTVRRDAPVDLAFDLPELADAIARLRTLRADRGHYGGAGWANYVATYFNDSERFLASVARQLRPGGRAVVVVGNSVIQGMEFRVDQVLAQMAERRGLRVEQILVVRMQRVGSSIVASSVRQGPERARRERTRLYDAAIILRA